MASQDGIPPQNSPPQTGYRSRASSNATGGARPRTGSTTSVGRDRSGTAGSGGRLRSGSITRFLESAPGGGFWQTTGGAAGKAPTLMEIKSGSYTPDGWHEEGQLEHRGSTAHEIVAQQQRRLSRINSGLTRTTTSRSIATPATPVLPESQEEHDYGFTNRFSTIREGQTDAPRPISKEEIRQAPTAPKTEAEVTEATAHSSSSLSPSIDEPTVQQKDANGVMTTADPLTHETHEADETGTYPNGYRFPPKHNWKESTIIGCKALWKFTCTPLGFFVVLYALNVVAWGAMIFFVLLNAAPAMCHPSCNSDDSARKKWIEYDSQILNGLFCVTGFGLVPWRFRDLYFLMQYRMFKNIDGLRKLAGLNRGWFRLEGSQDLDEHFGPPPDPKAKPIPEGDHPPEYPPPPPYSEEEIGEMQDDPAVPIPVWKAPPAPLTGNRASPTKVYMLDLVIWLYIWNTLFQAALCYFLWGYGRIERPAWGTAVFIVLACLVGMGAGIVVFRESKRVKKVEGVPISDADRMKMLMADEEARAGDLAEKKDASIFKKDWDANGKAMK